VANPFLKKSGGSLSTRDASNGNVSAVPSPSAGSLAGVSPRGGKGSDAAGNGGNLSTPQSPRQQPGMIAGVEYAAAAVTASQLVDALMVLKDRDAHRPLSAEFDVDTHPFLAIFYKTRVRDIFCRYSCAIACEQWSD
jgi:hypothetical protein